MGSARAKFWSQRAHPRLEGPIGGLRGAFINNVGEKLLDFICWEGMHPTGDPFMAHFTPVVRALAALMRRGNIWRSYLCSTSFRVI